MKNMTAVDVKDRLFDLLREPVSGIEFCKVGERVLDILDMTDGLWEDLEYSYKAVEICQRIRDKSDKFGYSCQHHLTLGRLEKLRQASFKLMEYFHWMQVNRMHPVTDPEITSLKGAPSRVEGGFSVCPDRQDLSDGDDVI